MFFYREKKIYVNSLVYGFIFSLFVVTTLYSELCPFYRYFAESWREIALSIKSTVFLMKNGAKFILRICLGQHLCLAQGRY